MFYKIKYYTYILHTLIFNMRQFTVQHTSNLPFFLDSQSIHYTTLLESVYSLQPQYGKLSENFVFNFSSLTRPLSRYNSFKYVKYLKSKKFNHHLTVCLSWESCLTPCPLSSAQGSWMMRIFVKIKSTSSALSTQFCWAGVVTVLTL